MNKKNYQKVTGKTRNFMSTGQIWQQDDHLLSIEETLVGQTYRRLFFKDIESLVLYHTSYRYHYLGVLAILSFIIGMIFLMNKLYATFNGRVTIGIVFGLLAVVAFSIFIRGTICKIQLQTKNGPYNLPVRLRIFKARKLVRKLNKEINASQL
ncbi:MAG: hypothetical protein HQK83_20265 [Fibrobacteria bacterium]|nr:hypothetical protein [Fibrobacteria bacterium]